MSRFVWRGRAREDNARPKERKPGSRKRRTWPTPATVTLTGEELAWLKTVVGACTRGWIDVAHPDLAKQVFTKLTQAKPEER